jgi:hypothetical protein
MRRWLNAAESGHAPKQAIGEAPTDRQSRNRRREIDCDINAGPIQLATHGKGTGAG